MKNLRPFGPIAAALPLFISLSVAIAACLVLSSIRAGCAQTPGAKASLVDPALSVVLDASAQKRAGIATAPLIHVFRANHIRAYGTVISTAGLSSLESSYAVAAAKVENAKTTLHVSQREYARLKNLYERNQSSSLKELQLAQSKWNQDKVNLRAAKTQQTALACAALQQWGKVISDWVFTGAAAYSKLSDRQDALVLVTLPAGEKIAAMPGEITIKPAGLGRFKARFVSASPRTDPQIQGFSYFYIVSNRSGQVRTGMNVSAFLPEGPPTGGFLIVSSAVVWQDAVPFVFVQTGARRFEARPIGANIPVAGGYLVGKGFSLGDRIVVEGAQTLLSQALLSGSKSGAGHGDGDDD
ncbi:MAG: efflux RND transporter periplasmic adaptor subunit [Syntrophobacteraceae bacterium]